MPYQTKMDEGQEPNRMPDLLQYNKHFEDLRRIFEEVLELKKKGNEVSNKAIIEKQKSASLLFIMLKKLNRLDKYRIREGRDALQKERIRVDSKRLQLQNLLYEVNHIKREIMRCYQFKSQDENIDLVSEEEFYASAPKSISRPEITKDAEHAKRLARLEWELNQRKELFALCKELTVEKQKASEEISQKIHRLSSYGPCVTSLLKATKPLQLALDMAVEQKWEINRFVKLLPKPLYLLYVNINAYIEVSEPNINVVILGTEEDMRLYEDIKPTEFLDEAESDSDEADMDAQTRKTHKRLEDILFEQRRLLLQPHPLANSIIITDKSKSSITVNVYYFPQLALATAAGTINLNKVNNTTGEIVSPENILDHLFDDDVGLRSPVSNLLYQLKKINMSESDCLNHLRENGYGKPYKWVQRMCGITFHEENTSSENIVLEKIIPEIISRLKQGWSSRLNLIKQINALENKNIELHVTIPNVTYAQHSCSLVLWAAVTWEDIVSNIETSKFVELGWVNPHHLFYRAVVVRGSSKLECFVSISNTISTTYPVWILSVSWNGQHNALNNSAVKDMEYWTNSISYQGKYKCDVLSAQLARTMNSFDIFLETEGRFYSPVEFSKEKHFVKPFSMRIRARPYRCIERGSNQIFTQ